MKLLLEQIAKALVDHPDEVEVQLVEGERSIILELRVAPRMWARLSASKAGLPRPFARWLALPPTRTTSG